MFENEKASDGNDDAGGGKRKPEVVEEN